MKGINPSKRNVELDSVLQFDSERQSQGKGALLSVGQRITINQERAAILAGNFAFENPLEEKIQAVLLDIKARSWKPKETIEYAYSTYTKD